MPKEKKPYCYSHPRPGVTVDLVLFGVDGDELKVLLIKRGQDPYANHWAFPGGFLDIQETLENAVRRELLEETGLAFEGQLTRLGVYAEPGRDPRGRTISVAFVAVIPPPLPKVDAGDDAGDAAWVLYRDATPLAFDHDEMLAEAIAWLRCAVIDGRAAIDLLPRDFSQEDLQRVFRAIGAPVRKALACRSRLLRAGAITPVARKAHTYRSQGR